MRWLRPFALVFLPLLSVFLPSCGPNSTAGSHPGRHPAGIGPFDRNGNYVEAWADTPSKWGKKSAFGSVASNAPANDETPAVASNDEPPADAVPLAPTGSSAIQTVKAPPSSARKNGEVVVATLTKPKNSAGSTVKARTSQSDDEDTPRATVKKPTTSREVATKTKPKLTPKELAAAKAKAKAKATATASTKAKSKATASSTTKKKPSARYTVKKGDNLVKIADRFDTTAAAIKKANGLKTGVVPPGKTLVIPKG